MKIIGQLIAKTVKNIGHDAVKQEVKEKIKELTSQHPLYPNLKYN